MWIPISGKTICVFQRGHGSNNLAIEISRASVHQLDGRLSAKSHEVLKAQDSGLDVYNRSEIWQVHLGGNVVETPAKSLSDTIIVTSNLAASSLGDKTSVRMVNRGSAWDNDIYFPGLINDHSTNWKVVNTYPADSFGDVMLANNIPIDLLRKSHNAPIPHPTIL